MEAIFNPAEFLGFGHVVTFKPDVGVSSPSDVRLAYTGRKNYQAGPANLWLKIGTPESAGHGHGRCVQNLCLNCRGS